MSGNDEISMVGNTMFSLLDTRLKKIKGNNQIFRVVSGLFGDFFVTETSISWLDFPGSKQRHFQICGKICLRCKIRSPIMRQKGDLEVAELLNRLRQNNLSDNDFPILNTRMVQVNDESY